VCDEHGQNLRRVGVVITAGEKANHKELDHVMEDEVGPEERR
jgi:hypothetical protein